MFGFLSSKSGDELALSDSLCTSGVSSDSRGTLSETTSVAPAKLSEQSADTKEVFPEPFGKCVKMHSSTVLVDEKRLSRYLQKKALSRQYHDELVLRTTDQSSAHCLFEGAHTTSNMVTNRQSRVRSRGKSGGVKEASDGATWTISNPVPGSRLGQGISNKPYKFVQEYALGTLVTTSNAATTYGSAYFTIGGLDQVSALASVFDQYKIDEIECWVQCQYGSSIPDGIDVLWATVIDYDDANNLTTYASALDYVNVVQTPINTFHYRRWRPHVAVATYSGTFTSYANVVAPWIDFTSQAVQHYGLKIAAQTTPGNAHPIVAWARLHISVRNVR